MSLTPTTGRAEDLFLAACDLPAGDRADFLAGQCGDQALRREVDALLADLDRATAAGFLDPGGPPGGPPGLAAGARLGEYEVVRLLGEGGSGRVYEARHVRLGRRVAVKVLSDAARLDPDALARFRREIAAVGAVSHPNVVAATDARRFGPHFFLVTELLEGVTLRELMLARPALPVPDAAEVARQLAAGVQCLADRGLVHRDLSPANVMVTTAGRVAILDLGLAGLAGRGGTHRLTATGLFVGTVGYLSPEQSEDARAVDHRSDLYAVGCLFYSLLAGHPPFRENPAVSVRQWLNRLCAETPPDIRLVRPDVPVPVAEVCTRLLATRPADRYDTPDAVADQLAPIAAGNALASTVQAVRDEAECGGAAGVVPGLPGRGSQTYPRPVLARKTRRGVLLGGVIAAAVGLAAVILRAMNGPRPEPRPGPPPRPRSSTRSGCDSG